MAGSGWDERPLSEFLPEGQEESLNRLPGKAASAILLSIERELLSSSGQRMLLRMAKEFVDRSKGFMGVMAAIFVDEDKLVTRITPLLAEQLRSDKVHETVTRMLERKLEEWVSQPPAELLRAWSGEDSEPAGQIIGLAKSWLQWSRRLERWRRAAEPLAGGEQGGMAALCAAARRFCDWAAGPQSGQGDARRPPGGCGPFAGGAIPDRAAGDDYFERIGEGVPRHHMARGAAWGDYRLDPVVDSARDRFVAPATAAAPVWYADNEEERKG